MADLHDLTALEQGGLVRRREVSPLELTEHYLERADRLDSVGAFVTLTPEQARSRAAGLPAAMSSGKLTRTLPHGVEKVVVLSPLATSLPTVKPGALAEP